VYHICVNHVISSALALAKSGPWAISGSELTDEPTTNTPEDQSNSNQGFQELFIAEQRIALNLNLPTAPRPRRLFDQETLATRQTSGEYPKSATRLSSLYRAPASIPREPLPMVVPCGCSKSHVQATTTTQSLSFVASHTLPLKTPPPPIPRASEVVHTSSQFASAILDGRWWCVPIPPAGDGAVLLSTAQSTQQS
jgi:hypothetical protein